MPSTTPTSKVGRANKCAPWLIIAITLTASVASAQTTNALAPKLELPALPDAGPSILRVMGALALVLGGLMAALLAAYWLYLWWGRRPPPLPPVARDYARFCLRLAKLNLYQCLASSGPHYEDIFCLGQHAMIDPGQCVVEATRTPVAHPVAVTKASYRR